MKLKPLFGIIRHENRTEQFRYDLDDRSLHFADNFQCDQKNYDGFRNTDLVYNRYFLPIWEEFCKTKWGIMRPIIFIIAILFPIITNAQHQISVKTPWPDSLHANHIQSDGSANENNGGYGWFIGYKNLDKGGIDIGIGQIFGTNSFGDPLRVDILQLADASIEIKSFRIGISAWLMDIYGYYNCYSDNCDQKEIVHNVPPWPIPHIGFNPWDNLLIEARYVNFITVSITFAMIEYRLKF